MSLSETEKEYRRRWYVNNKHKVLEANNKRRRALREQYKELKKAPCTDCKKSFPHYVMDFDHRPDVKKTADLSVIITKGSRRKLFAEIAKCDLVCVNCHRIRTFKRRKLLH